MQGQGTQCPVSPRKSSMYSLTIGAPAGYFTSGTKENIPFARERAYTSA